MGIAQVKTASDTLNIKIETFPGANDLAGRLFNRAIFAFTYSKCAMGLWVQRNGQANLSKDGLTLRGKLAVQMRGGKVSRI